MDSKNWPLLREALQEMGRATDWYGKQHLIPILSAGVEATTSGTQEAVHTGPKAPSTRAHP